MKKNPKSYAITEDFINNTEDKELEFALFDFILDVKLTDYEKEHEIVTALPEGLIMLYATWLVESEVNNGGFNQFFFNSSNQFVNEALDGFQLIGAVKHADLLHKAVKVFMTEIDMQKEMRKRGTIEAFSESYNETKLNDLDKLFYNIDENLSKLRINYIRNNLHKFLCE